MLKLYNTLTRKKEIFKPINPKSVGMYSCGPTVYNFAHIGNFRAYVCSDILKRYLLYKKFKVKHVMNITDVDDKTIKGSIKEGISLKQYTSKYTKSFFEDLKTLNISKADVYPKATEHITEMVNLIKRLLKKKIAYKSDDGIYFDISKFKNYGKLSKLKFEDLETGKRIKADEYEKKTARDFALWKFWDDNDGKVFWQTEIGKGRPGWHIECSAMSTKYLGQPFDIHTGGIDLVFPHHENEIAQSEAAYGKKFVNYWVHNEWLLVEGKKMSKSLGNFYTLRDLLSKGYSAFAVKYVLMSAHYRQHLNFTFDGLEAAKNSINHLKDFILHLDRCNGKDVVDCLQLKKDFEKAMDDDLNISNAFGSLFSFVNFVYKKNISKKTALQIKKLFLQIDKILGLGLDKIKSEKIPDSVIKLAEKREKSRKEKKWDEADKIRDEILNKGWIVEDSEKGFALKKAEMQEKAQGF